MKKNFCFNLILGIIVFSFLITSFVGCDTDNGDAFGDVAAEENGVTTKDTNADNSTENEDVTTSGKSEEEEFVASFRGLKVLSIESDAGDVVTVEKIEYDTMEQHISVTLSNNSSTAYVFEKHYTITKPDGSEKTDWVSNQTYPLRANKSTVLDINPQYWGEKKISGTYKIEHHVMEHGTLNKFTFIYTLRYTPCEPTADDPAPSYVSVSPTNSAGKAMYSIMSASTGKVLVIPRVVDKHDITNILSIAFRDSEYEKAIIKDNIQYIEYNAFKGSSKLKSISLGSGLREIGYDAFKNCSSLTDIYYNGTKSKWETIKKGDGWDEGMPKYTVHCTDGDIIKE